MNANRVKVFHRADSDYIRIAVTHNLKLNFLPAGDTFFDQNLMNRRAVKAVMRNLVKFALVFRNSAACSAERKRRTDNHREADYILRKIQSRIIIRYDFAWDARLADCFHRVLEHLPVLGLVDCLRSCSQKLDIVAFQKS